MFGWFKKKDTRTKIIEQYKKQLDRLNKIDENFVQTETNILENAREVLISDLEVIGEIYATTVKGKEEIEITLKDVDKQTPLVDKILTPVGHYSREIEFTGDVSIVDNLVKVQPDSYVVEFVSVNSDYYHKFENILKKRDKINSSKLKSKVKRLYNSKVLETKYKTEAICKFSPMFGKNMDEWLKEYEFNSVKLKEVERFKDLEDIFYLRQENKPWQTIVLIPYCKLENLLSNKYYKYMLDNNKLSIAYHKGL